jgi:hypothetical protein
MKDQIKAWPYSSCRPGFVYVSKKEVLMRKLLTLTAAAAALALWRNLRRGTPASIPGERKQPDSWLLEKGAALFQDTSPLHTMNLYLNGFHFYADDMGRQMEAHHYCTQLNEDFHQCVIFDGNHRAARLIGVEYILSEKLFKTLPEEEKKLWHSHQYEVKSGTLIAPGLPPAAEHEVMKKIVTTYGKVWHLWDVKHYDLPIGIPALMMAFTSDGQMDAELVKNRDSRFNVSTAERSQKRADIPMTAVLEGADSWKHGRSSQLRLEQVSFSVIAGADPAEDAIRAT